MSEGMNWIEEAREQIRLGAEVAAGWLEYRRKWNRQIPMLPGQADEGKRLTQLTRKVLIAEEKILAAIPDKPEMVKLLKWVRKKEVAAEYEYRRAQGGWKASVSFEEVRKYIEREFGYKLEDEK